jgi:hypothetical protein
MQIVFVFEFKFSRPASLPHSINQLKIEQFEPLRTLFNAEPDFTALGDRLRIFYVESPKLLINTELSREGTQPLVLRCFSCDGKNPPSPPNLSVLYTQKYPEHERHSGRLAHSECDRLSQLGQAIYEKITPLHRESLANKVQLVFGNRLAEWGPSLVPIDQLVFGNQATLMLRDSQ